MAAASRLLQRLCRVFPKAFDVLTVDGLYARTGFFSLAQLHNKHVIAVLKDDRRDLLQDAASLFEHAEPMLTWEDKSGQYAVCDDEGFLTWESVNCPVRVVMAIERKLEKGRMTTKRWFWVTTMSIKFALTRTVWRIGHARWDIENRFFNDAVNHYALDRAYMHHPTAILVIAMTLATVLILVNAFYLLNLKPATRARHTKQSLVEQFKESFRHAVETFAPT